jgi:hypothetical protein
MVKGSQIKGNCPIACLPQNSIEVIKQNLMFILLGSDQGFFYRPLGFYRWPAVTVVTVLTAVYR